MQKKYTSKKSLVFRLRYLGEGCSQQVLNLGFRVGKSTVSKILMEVCEALYTVLATHFLRPPSVKEEWKQISSEFLELGIIPHVTGAIDDKHVAMECLKNTG